MRSTDLRLASLLRREAEAEYSSRTAEAYRESDETGKDSITHSGKCEIIRQLSERFRSPVSLLDLGCGNGPLVSTASVMSGLLSCRPIHGHAAARAKSCHGGHPQRQARPQHAPRSRLCTAQLRFGGVRRRPR